jgi:hypothetical protein
MNDNQKLIGYIGSIIMSFAIAAFFKFYLNIAADIVVALCAIGNLAFAWAPQRLDRQMPAAGRAVLLAFAVIAAGIFGGFFLSGTMTAIYVAVTVAVAFAAIAKP